MKRKVIVIVALLAASMSLLIAAAALYSRGAATVPADTAEPAMNAETTPDPEEQARQEALAAKRADALSRAQTLAQQYFYDEAIAALYDAELECDEIAAARAERVAFHCDFFAVLGKEAFFGQIHRKSAPLR